MKTSLIVLSVPRSGTHLVMKKLRADGYLEYYADSVPSMFRMPPTGYFCFGGHMSYEGNYKYFNNSKYLGVFVQRDPRDVLVSLAEFIGDRDKTHEHHSLFSPLDTDTRIRLLITGDEENGVPSLLQRYKEVIGWQTHERVVTVYFERVLVGNPSLRGVSPGEHYYPEFRAGRVGDWYTAFTQEHIDLYQSEFALKYIYEGLPSTPYLEEFRASACTGEEK